MALLEREIDIATGRRSADGHVRISVFAEGLLALTVEGTGERVPTLLLTTEQAQKLQRALAELIPLAEDDENDASSYGQWDGNERRTGRQENEGERARSKPVRAPASSLE